MRALTGTYADLDLSRADLELRRRDDRAGRLPTLRDDIRSWPCSVELPKVGTVTLAEWRERSGFTVHAPG